MFCRLDFDAVEDLALNLSNVLASLPATAPTPQLVNQVLRINVTGADVEVINVPADVLLNARALDVSGSFADNATVIVNVVGSPCGVQDVDLTSLAPLRSSLLWNFVNCTRLTLSGVAVQGTVWAPRATVTAANGMWRPMMISVRDNDEEKKNMMIDWAVC